MYCSNCGTKIDEGASFCFNCGVKISGNKIETKGNKKKEIPKEFICFAENILVDDYVQGQPQSFEKLYKKAKFYDVKEETVNEFIEKCGNGIKKLERYIEGIYEECRLFELNREEKNEILQYGNSVGLSLRNTEVLRQKYERMHYKKEQQNFYNKLVGIFGEDGRISSISDDNSEKYQIEVYQLFDRNLLEVEMLIKEQYEKNDNDDYILNPEQMEYIYARSDKLFTRKAIDKIIYNYEKKTGIQEKKEQLSIRKSKQLGVVRERIEGLENLILTQPNYFIAIGSDGTVKTYGEGCPDLSDWKDIASIIKHGDMIVGLHSFGGFVATRENWKCSYSLQGNIISVDFSDGRLWGLCADGKTFCLDYKEMYWKVAKETLRSFYLEDQLVSGVYGVTQYSKDNIKIGINKSYSTGTVYKMFLTKDGTLWKDCEGGRVLCKDVVYFANDSTKWGAVKRDGTGIVDGCELRNYKNGELLKNVVKIYFGINIIAALCSDGTVYTCNYFSNRDALSKFKKISQWKNIVSIALTSNNIMLGLQEDGTVVTHGNISPEMRDVYNWRDIVSITCYGSRYAVGIHSDGTVVCTNSKIDTSNVKVFGSVETYKTEVSEQKKIGLREKKKFDEIAEYTKKMEEINKKIEWLKGDEKTEKCARAYIRVIFLLVAIAIFVHLTFGFQYLKIVLMIATWPFLIFAGYIFYHIHQGELRLWGFWVSLGGTVFTWIYLVKRSLEVLINSRKRKKEIKVWEKELKSIQLYLDSKK